MNQEIRELGKKSIIVLVGRIIGELISFISVIVIGRLLGAEVYGQFVYITSFLLFFTILPKLGMENSIVSFLSRSNIDLEQKKGILTFSLIIVMVLSLLVVFFSYFNANFINQKLLNSIKYGELFVLLLPTVILDSIRAILRSSLRAVRKINEITLIDNLVNPIIKTTFIIVLVIIFNIKNYYSLVIPLYISSFTAITYYVYKLRSLNLIGKTLGIKKFDNKNFIKFSLPLLFTGIMTILIHNVDRYMIGYLIGVKNLGIYKVALQFGTASSIALFSVNIIFAPLISNLYHDNRRKDLRKMYQLTTKWVTIINLLIFGIILIFSKEIMNIAGEEFIIGGTALILITLGQVINSIFGPVGYINIMTGHPRFELISAVSALIVNVILNIFLIVPYGINGAAIATAISLLTRNILSFVLMYKILKIHPYNKSYLNIAGVFISMVVLFFVISNFIHVNYLIRLIIFGTIYSIIYLLLVYKFVMNNNEIKVLKTEILKVFKKL